MGQTISSSFVWRARSNESCRTCNDEPYDDEGEEEAVYESDAGTAVDVVLEPEATLPSRASAGAAGYDLYASEDVLLKANDRTWSKVHTGVRLAIDRLDAQPGVVVYGAIRARSGLTLRGIAVFHGTIDADFRGELIVLMRNETDTDFEVKKKDRIAQLLFSLAFVPRLADARGLDETVRGEGGFGSTGVAAAVAAASTSAETSAATSAATSAESATEVAAEVTAQAIDVAVDVVETV